MGERVALRPAPQVQQSVWLQNHSKHSMTKTICSTRTTKIRTQTRSPHYQSRIPPGIGSARILRISNLNHRVKQKPNTNFTTSQGCSVCTTVLRILMFLTLQSNLPLVVTTETHLDPHPHCRLAHHQWEQHHGYVSDEALATAAGAMGEPPSTSRHPIMMSNRA